MPRVLFLAPSAYTLGGVQVWLDYLVHGLSVRGWDVVLGLVSGKFHRFQKYLEIYPFAPSIEIRAKSVTPYARQLAIAKAIMRLDPDIVVAVNVADVYPATSRLPWSQRRKLKVIGAEHSLQPDYLEDARTFRGTIDALVCASRLTAKMFQEAANYPPERIFYVPCGVQPVPAVVNETFGDSLTLGYVGRFEGTVKRVFDVIEILERARKRGFEVRLIAAGDGPDFAEFQHRCNEKGFGEAVDLLGNVAVRNVSADVLQKIDALIVASNSETGPIVAWEAMMHGLPVITSNFLGLSSEGALRHGENCLVFPVGDSEAAVDQLGKLINRNVRQRLGCAARSLILERYTRDRSIAGWADAFSRTLDFEPLAAVPTYQFPKRGRLDDMLGVSVAHKLRAALGIYGRVKTAGDEWPHSYGSKRIAVGALEATR